MMSEKYLNLQAIKYIREISELGKGNLICDNPNHLMSLIQHDFYTIKPVQRHEYIDNVINAIPSPNLPLLLDVFLHQPQNTPISDAFITYLIRCDRPIFQIKALEHIQKNNNISYTPFVIPLIYSPNSTLQQKAIEYLIHHPQNLEPILEQQLLDRSETKREIASKVLQRINPKNLKLVPFLLESGDFLKRIDAIQIMAATNDRKWIDKIQPALNDSDLAVRKTAIEAILTLGGRKAKQIIVKYISEESHDPLKRMANILLEQQKN